LKYLILLLFAGFSLPACKKQPETIRPRLESISESVYASGIIKSSGQYQVFSTVGGLIQKILVKEGDLVKKGDALLIIENATARLNAENAQLAVDFANLNAQGDRLNELQSTVETTKSRMLSDSSLLVRQRGLWAQQIGSHVELEQRELAYTSSVNGYRAAVSRYRDLQKQLQFAAAQSKKLLSISKDAARNYVVRSQTDGRVYSIAKETGEIVGPQSPVAIIGDANDFVAELQVDENDIVRVQKGQRVLISMDSYKGQVFEAEITTMDPIMNERSRTFPIEAIFTKKPPVLYPNLTVEANIIIQSKTNAVVIPRMYLLGDSAVLLTDKTRRSVKIGLKDYLKAEILSGLDTSVTLLKPGQ
jgi:multidrug efflux pump subunit AcrA (membrane-fusion protein)